jgi:Tfp pilus assembly protein PilV
MATEPTTPQATRQAREDRRGFPFKGTLITLVVLAVCALGLATVIGDIRSRSVDQHVITATDLARDILERIKRADYVAVIAANYPQEDYETMTGHAQFRRTVTINEATPEWNTKTITVTVSWRDPMEITHHVTLSTIISR